MKAHFLRKIGLGRALVAKTSGMPESGTVSRYLLVGSYYSFFASEATKVR
jgi:hypothetical protein